MYIHTCMHIYIHIHTYIYIHIYIKRLDFAAPLAARGCLAPPPSPTRAPGGCAPPSCAPSVNNGGCERWASPVNKQVFKSTEVTHTHNQKQNKPTDTEKNRRTNRCERGYPPVNSEV